MLVRISEINPELCLQSFFFIPLLRHEVELYINNVIVLQKRENKAATRTGLIMAVIWFNINI